MSNLEIVTLYKDFCDAMLQADFMDVHGYEDLTRGLDVLSMRGRPYEVASVLMERLGTLNGNGIQGLESALDVFAKNKGMGQAKPVLDALEKFGAESMSAISLG